MVGPRISVIIPVFNRENFIQDALRSVLNQSYQQFELIVIDDGSTDETRSKILEIEDPRIRYIYQENRERAAARNAGIILSNGSYITFLDSDDRFYESHLKVATEFIESNNSPEFFHLNYEIKDLSGNLIIKAEDRRGNLNSKLLRGNFLSCIGVFIRKDIIKENLFNESRTLSGTEDWELWMRLACQYTLLYSNEVTSCMIQHPSRSVEEINAQKLIDRIDLAANLVITNPNFVAKYNSKQHEVLAHLECYLSLHLILGNKIYLGFSYFLKALYHSPGIIFYRKSMGILKHLVLKTLIK